MIQFHTRTPRWIVILLDLGLALFSLFLSYFIRFDLNTDLSVLNKELNYTFWSLVFYVFLKFIVYFGFGIHKGLIRHTSLQDLKRIFTANALCTVVFVVTGVIKSKGFHSTYLFPHSVLIMEFIFSLTFVLGSRFAIKILYLESIKSRITKENVLIYGAGTMGLIAKQTIGSDGRNQQNIVGFMDDNPKLVGNKIEGIPVFDRKKLDDIHEQIDRVIIAIRNPNKSNQQDVIETCLKHHIKVQRVPDPQTWVNGELTPQKLSKIPIEELLGREPIRLNQNLLNENLKDKTILVTGAAGSIGRGLVIEILKYGPNRIVLLDQAETPLYDFQQEISKGNENMALDFIVGDIQDLGQLKHLFTKYKPQIIFHAAAYKHVPLMEENPGEAVKTNVFGTKNLIDLSVENKVESFIMISTDKAVNPTNIMGASKRIAEIYAQHQSIESNTRIITTRFGNVLGSNGSVIPLFERQIEKGGPVTVTDERITRYFMTIPEACQLVLEAFSMGKGSEIFVFDMGESVKIVDLAKKMILLSELELGKDIEIKFVGLRPGEKLYEEVLADSEKTQATHHPKILIAQTRTNDPLFLGLLEQLSQDVLENDEVKLAATMKQMVPEFISHNSSFEALD